DKWERTGLAAGTYYVEATHTAATPTTSCTTSLFEFEIEDQTVDPIMDIVITPLTGVDTSCDPDANEGNGSFDWSITNAAAAGNGSFSFQWYAGSVGGTGALADGASITNASGTVDGIIDGVETVIYGSTFSGIDGNADGNGFYTLRITNLANPSATCFTDVTVEMTEQVPDITVTPLAVNAAAFVNTPNTNCSALFNGAFLVNDVTLNGTAAGNTAGYTFEYFKTGGAAHGGTHVPGAASITGLEDGDYYVVITNGDQCTSGQHNFTIDDNSVDPIVIELANTSDSNCSSPGANTGNGSLSVQLQSGAAVTDYSYVWYRGTDTSDGDYLITTVASTNAQQGSAVQDGGTGNSISALAPGQYTVIVTDTQIDGTNDNCPSTTTFTINNEPQIHEITNVTEVHITDCATTGSASIEDIDIGLDDQADYDYTWYLSDAVTPIAQGT
ncbi:MAG: hypothetical protein ACRBG0_28045, partial [Lewinella sp.]|uniref:hypothetical protein n=1 Tax=Lewinella sp. TaxID=2004506 RepID=UPI003D6B5CA1